MPEPASPADVAQPTEREEVLRLEAEMAQNLNMSASQIATYKKKIKPILMGVAILLVVGLFFYLEFVKTDKETTKTSTSVFFNFFNKSR